jgi:hypothetical protein
LDVDASDARRALEGDKEGRIAIGARGKSESLGIAPFAAPRPPAGIHEGMAVQQPHIRQSAILEYRAHAEQPAEVRHSVKNLLGFRPGQIGQTAQAHPIRHCGRQPQRAAEPHTLINAAGGVQRGKFDGLWP